MDVVFTGSWYDEAGEKSAAINLIDNYNVALVSQHADSMGAPTACEQKNIPNVSYNGSTETATRTITVSDSSSGTGGNSGNDTNQTTQTN